MNNPHAADSAIGERLKKAREAAGYSLSDVSARLRMPVRVLQVLESGDWAALGAPVFVRGQVRSYARLLGVSLDEQVLPSPFTTAQIPSLVSHSHVPRYRHVAENLARRGVYIVLTAALVVPVWLATRGHLDGSGPAIAPLDVPTAGSGATSPATPARTPMVASIAALPTQETGAPGIRLEFTGESWVQIHDAEGRLIEGGLLRAGERRDLRGLRASRVVLGNAAAVRVLRGDDALDLAPYSQANVARFTLSSDGSLAPVTPAGP